VVESIDGFKIWIHYLKVMELWKMGPTLRKSVAGGVPLWLSCPCLSVSLSLLPGCGGMSSLLYHMLPLPWYCALLQAHSNGAANGSETVSKNKYSLLWNFYSRDLSQWWKIWLTHMWSLYTLLLLPQHNTQSPWLMWII
jgi:hypothetical protein